ncbi:hypothetical protein FPV67DRAFT_216773 [Lyophyllum atratum]|nr:hypothetical protein FPV67DRAFT_216773 [Lyophyllum atratum]
MANTVIVDDRDARIAYSSGWFSSGGPNEFDSTTHGSRAAGVKATFRFTGSSVAVYGTVADSGVYKDPPISTYSIDGSSSVTYSAVPGSKAQYKQRYFQSPDLSDGEHTLVITSTVANAYFWLDYLEFAPAVEAPPAPAPQDPVTTVVTTVKPETTNQPSNPTPNTTTTNPKPTTGREAPTTTNSNPSNTAIQNGDASSTNLQLGASQTPTNSAAPAVASGSKVPAGAIAGAIAGAVIITVLVAVILLLLRRQRRRNAETALTQPVTPTGVTPFMGGAPGSSMSFSNDQVDASHTASSPYPSVGYVTHGGTYSEKAGMHRSQPSQSNSHVTSSSQGLLDPGSEASSTSPYGGTAPSKWESIMAAGPSYSQPPARFVANPSLPRHPQSYGAGSLYHDPPDDIPPAYYQSPAGPSAS